MAALWQRVFPIQQRRIAAPARHAAAWSSHTPRDADDPSTYLRLADPQRGLGVFAQKTIARGTVVWLHDELIRSCHPSERPACRCPARAGRALCLRQRAGQPGALLGSRALHEPLVRADDDQHWHDTGDRAPRHPRPTKS